MIYTCQCLPDKSEGVVSLPRKAGQPQNGIGSSKSYRQVFSLKSFSCAALIQILNVNYDHIRLAHGGQKKATKEYVAIKYFAS